MSGLQRITTAELLAIAHGLLARPHIEATLIALATIRPDVAQSASRRAWRSELSPDALTLLDRICDDPRAAWLTLTTLAESEAQFDLTTAALDLKVSDLTFHSVGSLIALARGRLPACEVAA